jgi:hypothetical protein
MRLFCTNLNFLLFVKIIGLNFKKIFAKLMPYIFSIYSARYPFHTQLVALQGIALRITRKLRLT